MDEKRVVILGGGSGGIVAANELRKRLDLKHRVILIDREENHLFYPSLLWLIFGWRKPEELQRRFSLLTKKGIEFVKGTVTKIEIEKKKVLVDSKEIDYDYLIISLGAEIDKTLLPKIPNIYNFYCLEGARLTGDAIQKFSSGKIIILISSLPFKCPAAPYEMGFLLDAFFKNKGIRDKIEIEIYTPENLPMSTAGPELGNLLVQILEKRAIKFNPGYKFESVREQEIIFGNNKKIAFDLLLAVPPHKAPMVVKEAGLTSETGWIPVDREIFKTKFDNVYALGDITTIKLPGQYEQGKVLNLPKAGVFAHYQAKIVAGNIASEIQGSKSEKKFSGTGYCFIELGSLVASFSKGNFYTQPCPQVKLYPPLKFWHWAKTAFEKWWFWRWF